MEHLPEDEMPPRRIWGMHERLDEWFAAVKQRRKDHASGRTQSIPDDREWDAEKYEHDPEVSALRDS